MNITKSIYLGTLGFVLALVPLLLYAGLWVSFQMRDGADDIKEMVISHAKTIISNYDTAFKQHIHSVQALSQLSFFDEPEYNLSLIHGELKKLIKYDSSTWEAFTLIRVSDSKTVMSTDTQLGENPNSIPINPNEIGDIANNKKTYIFSRYTNSDAFSKTSFISVIVPVIRNDESKYLLALDLSNDAVQRILSNSILDASGIIGSAILDSQMHIVARSSKPEERIGQLVGKNEYVYRTTEEGFNPVTSIDGKQVYAAHKKSLFSGWTAVVTTDRDSYNLMLTRQNWSLVFSALLCVVASMVALSMVFQQRRKIDSEKSASLMLKQTEAALDERNILLKEVYHRVKNNLQVIQSLLRLRAKTLSPIQREPFEDAVTRVGAMAQVHSILYRSNDLKTIEASAFVRDIVAELMSAYQAQSKGVKEEITSQTLQVSLDNATPLAFVIVELVTNSLKHAFKGTDGLITVDVFERDGEGVMRYSDNGIGLPEDYRKKKTLGLKMTERLAVQLGGKILWPQPGFSNFEITFKLNVSEAEATRTAFATGPLPRQI